MWPLYAGVAAYAVNMFATHGYHVFSPFKLVFACKPQDWLNLAFPPLEQSITIHYKESTRQNT